MRLFWSLYAVVTGAVLVFVIPFALYTYFARTYRWPKLFGRGELRSRRGAISSALLLGALFVMGLSQALRNLELLAAAGGLMVLEILALVWAARTRGPSDRSTEQPD